MELNWSKIDDLEDYFITYLLYKDSFTVPQISRIRNKSIEDINLDLINAKTALREEKKEIVDEKDIIKEYLAMVKEDRLDFIVNLSDDDLLEFKKNVYIGIMNTENVDDLIVFIWTAGELKDKRFLKILYPLLDRRHVHIRRISYSAIGKIGDPESRYTLELGLLDSNPQVRMYCAKYLSKVGNLETVRILENIIKNKAGFEKAYVIRACNSTLNILYERFGLKK